MYPDQNEYSPELYELLKKDNTVVYMWHGEMDLMVSLAWLLMTCKKRELDSKSWNLHCLCEGPFCVMGLGIDWFDYKNQLKKA